MKNGGAKINETDESVRSRTFLVIHEMLEILRYAYHQRYVKAALVGVALSAWQDSTVVAEVEDESVLQQTVRLEIGHHLAHELVDDSHAIKVSSMGVSKGGSIGMIRMQFHLVLRSLGLLVPHQLGGEMERAFMALGKGLHMKERHALVRTTSPRGFIGRKVPHLLPVIVKVIVRFSVVRTVVPRFL